LFRAFLVVVKSGKALKTTQIIDEIPLVS